MSTKPKLGPASKKQEMFLQSKSDITVFGGAAGSGKSYLGIMDMLQYVHMPEFRGVMVRRTTPMLKGVGGLLDTASNMYKEAVPNIRVKPSTMEFSFPSGAEIKMCHCEREADKHNFQGWQVAAFLIDEGQQMLESQVTYFISRMRTMAPMKPVMKITCNPEYNSFLRKWLQDAGYLDESNYGVIKPEMDGVEKWFIRQGNTMIWSTTKEELLETYGDDCGPMSFRMISANCRDNPVLLQHDPLYESRLKSLPRVERMRLLEGAWLVQEEAAGHWKKEWCPKIVMADVPELTRVIRCYDLAGSIPSEKYPDPDYTAGVLAGVDKTGHIYILDVRRFRKRYAGVIQEIIDIGLQDQKDWGDVVTYIPEDPSSAGKASCAQMLNELTMSGLTVKKLRTSNTKNRKLKAFEPFAVASENGMVSIVKADWNDDYCEELELFDPSVRSSGVHDDMVDASGDCLLVFKTIRKSRIVPIPDVSSSTTLLSQHKTRVK
jgi:predicted phage terminase large subunit-like protein